MWIFQRLSWLRIVLALGMLGLGQDSAWARDITWKAVLIAGDNVQNVFDTAVNDMADQLQEVHGFDPDHIRILSAAAEDVNDQPTARTIDGAFRRLDIGKDDGCFVFVTSHGDTNGLVIRTIRNYLTPNGLTRIVDKFCKQQPTVLILSGCHSGVFINSGDLAASNRVILTASHAERVSFGCSNDEVYTFYDGCLLENLKPNLLWQEVAQHIEECVSRREEELDAVPSLPQTYIGDSVRNMLVFKH
ncbi:MAG: C13 family peptidase [Alphaproteobacteria bacterium]